MAPSSHFKMENALARAEELITVGQTAAALQLLYDAVMSKWYQHNLLPLEAIMQKFVDLCVDLRHGRTVKDGLHSYRGVCQNVNVQGLEVVIKRFLDRAETKLAEAKEKAAKEFNLPILQPLTDDLELEHVGIDFSDFTHFTGSAEEKKDREIVTPWLRFVWESYRIVLDLCRHNARLEALYREIVERAFNFVRVYQRKAEFRRLCEILRHHLGLIVRFPTQLNGVLLSSPESHQIQLDIRFGQLNLATELELWQEAFRSIEDIHGLFVVSRKTPKSAMIVTYYERLCRVFQMSENFLFLAAAWHKLFAIAKARGEAEANGSNNQQAQMVLLSTMAIPRLRDLSIASHLSQEDIDSKALRLTQFLGLAKVPTRKGLLREIISKQVLQHVPSEMMQLFTILEAKCIDPLTLTQSMKPLLTNLLASVPDMSKFAAAIVENAAARVLEGLSRSSESVAWSHLCALLDFTGVVEFDLEKFLLHGSRVGDFFLRIDQQAGLVRFERPCFERETWDISEDIDENPLVALVSEVNKAMAQLNPSSLLLPNYHERVTACLARRHAEHRENLGRKILIEKKKEQQEALQQQKEREEARERAIRLQQDQEAERIRISEETANRDRARLVEEREKIRRDQAAKRDQEIVRMKELAAKRLDQEKLQLAAKRLDHLERALRQEEIPMLEKDIAAQKTKDQHAYTERVRLLKENSLAKHRTDCEIKAKITAMMGDHDAFLARCRQQREEMAEKQRQEVSVLLEAEKEKRRSKAIADLEARKAREAAVLQAKTEAVSPSTETTSEPAKPAAWKPRVLLEQQQQQTATTASAGRTMPTSSADTKRSIFGSSGPSSSSTGAWRR